MPRSHHKIVFALFALVALLTAGPIKAQNFKNPRRIPTSATPSLVLVGDLNNDGRLDIVYLLTQSPANTIHSLIAQVDGSYVETPTVTLPDNSARCMLFDLNGDGLLDLTCGTNFSMNQSIASLLGRGDGTFGAPMYSSAATSQAGTSVMFPVAIGDLNHDGKPDIALSSLGGTIITMLGDGTGKFSIGSSTPSGNVGFRGTLADLNGDGNPDLYLLSGAGMSAVTLLGRSDGSFGNVSYTVNGVLADVDGDGHPDVIGGSTSLLAYHGNADGSFNSVMPLVNQSFPSDNNGESVDHFASVLAYHDVNGDGVPDVLANSGDGLTVLLGKPGLQFVPASHYPVGQDLLAGPYFTSDVAVDLDGDGHLDLVTAGPLGVYITYGRADGTFASADVYESGASVANGAVADFNGDGFADVVTTGDLQLNLSLGRGDGTFRPSQPISGSTVFPSDYQRPLGASIVHGDFNGDGHQDLLVTASTDFYGKQPYLFLGRGDGMFAAPIKAPADATYILQTSVADFDGDGRADFSYADLTPNQPPTIVTYLGQADGSFTRHTTTYPGGIFKFADMDGDGKPDLVSFSSQTLTIMPGRGDGTFSGATATLTLPASLGASDFTTGDLDGDGRPDIALLTLPFGQSDIFNVDTLTRFYNNGYPSFSAAVTTPIGPSLIQRIFSADLNGDGIADLLYDNGYSLYTNGAGSGITFVTGSASRTVSAETTVVAGQSLLFPTAIDLNGDGRLDLLTGNGDYNRHANTFTVLLNQGNTPVATGTLCATPEPSSLRAAFQLTATLAPPAGSAGATLSGSVAFSIDGAVVGSAPLVANSASLAGPATLTRGTHALAATWSGQVAVGTTPALGPLTLTATHRVVGLPSATTLMASATAVPAGTAITFTATTNIQGGTAPDLSKLQIVEGTTPLTPSTTISANSLTSTVVLAPGTHTLLAVFAGDANAEPSTSAPVTVTVAAAPTTLTLSNLAGVAFQNNAIVATAQFNPSPAMSPGGTVTFTLAGQLLGSAPLTTQNTATINVNQPAGTYPLHAVYAPGDTGVSAATTDGTVVIARAPVSLAFTSPVPPPAATQSKPAILSVNFDDLTGRHLATGSIVPTVDGTPQPPLALPTGTSFPFSVAGLAPGTHSLTLTYSGDANFLPATTATATLIVLNRDFTFGGDQTLTIPTQHFRSLPVQVASIGDFAAPVALTCANLPPFASCRFSQSPVSVTAGSTATFQLTVDTSALPGYMSARQTSQTRRIIAAALAPFTLLALLLSRRRVPALLLLLLAATAATLIGCSGHYPAYTPPGTYTIQVVGQSADTGGTSAALTHARPITLVVTP